jgi:arginine repressor
MLLEPQLNNQSTNLLILKLYKKSQIFKTLNHKFSIFYLSTVSRMLEDLSLLYVFNLVFCLREFNFIKKLEEKNESRKKCFKFLNRGAKKKSGGAKCNAIEVLVTKIKISGCAPAPPHYTTAPPLTTIL